MAKELIDKLGFVATQVRSWIDVLVLQVDQHTKSMNEDYEHFFRWYSEDMYKIQVELFYYRELQREIKTDSLCEVLSYLEGKIKEFEDELLEKGLSQHSTSPATNLAYTLRLEAKQHLRKRFQLLIKGIK